MTRTVPYEIVNKHEDLEIREYRALMVADVTHALPRKNARQTGFKALASFIFGNNQTQQKMPMTAPVLQFKNQQDEWTLRFFLPEGYEPDNTPTPNHSGIQCQQLAKIRYAVICFKGLSTDKRFAQHHELLVSQCKQHGIKTLKTPHFAYYNPPWHWPFTRHNEVWLEIE